MMRPSAYDPRLATRSPIPRRGAASPRGRGGSSAVREGGYAGSDAAMLRSVVRDDCRTQPRGWTQEHACRF